MENEIDSKVYRKALVQYPYNSDSDGSYLSNITSVKAFESTETNIVKVEIKTHRPGILIGKQGIQISQIKQLMEFMSGKFVEIFLIEEDMFQNLYSREV